MILNIAGIGIKISGSSPGNIVSGTNGLAEFLQTGVTGSLHFITDKEVTIPAGQITDIFESNGQRCILGKCNNGYTFEIERNDINPGTGFIMDGERVISNIDSVKFYSPHVFRFSLWLAYNLFALQQNIITVHASAVVKDGEAVIFLGESGTGKSTHARLWEEHIPGSFILNDDSPVLTISGDKILCHGSPWSGKGERYHNLSCPLKGIVRLSQAPINEITRLKKLNSIGALLPSLPPSFSKEENLLQMESLILSEILNRVPVFSLRCRPDKSAALLSYSTIFE